MVTRFVRGIVSARYLNEFHMMVNSTRTTPTHHSEMVHLPQTLKMDPEVQGEGAERIDSVSREPINQGLYLKPPVEPLLLLLQATQLDGKALPRESFTAMTVGTQVQQITGFRPIDIEVSNRDVILEFETPT